MIAAKKKSKVVQERGALDRRVRRMYSWFNRGNAERCYALLDPLLAADGRVDLTNYVKGLVAFKDAYGEIRPWHVRVSLHLDASKNKHDPRPFAYVYVTWQDKAHGFHMFRERWVKHDGKWYTRVAGLVPNKS